MCPNPPTLPEICALVTHRIEQRQRPLQHVADDLFTAHQTLRRLDQALDLLESTLGIAPTITDPAERLAYATGHVLALRDAVRKER